MIFELQILNIPHDKACKKFRDFLLETLDLVNALIVHYQQKDNKKVLLLRIDNKSKCEELCQTKLKFELFEIEFEKYEREVIQNVNRILQRRIDGEMSREEEEQISKVYLSNIVKNTTESQVEEAMAGFGAIKEIDIVGTKPSSSLARPANKKQKLKCTFAVVVYERFEDAVKAFFQDKVKIGKKRLKVKLFMAEKASKFAPKRKARATKNPQTATYGLKGSKQNHQASNKADYQAKKYRSGIIDLQTPESFSPKLDLQVGSFDQRYNYDLSGKSYRPLPYPAHILSRINSSEEQPQKWKFFKKKEVFCLKEGFTLAVTEKNHDYLNLRLNKPCRRRNGYPSISLQQQTGSRRYRF